MYSMVLMAALTTGMDMPDIGRRGRGGCCGGYAGCYGGYGGCYGGWGGCYGGYGGGYGGCWGGGYGGCYGGGWGGYGHGYGGYGRGYGGYVWGGAPMMSGYTYSSPMMYGNTLTPGWGSFNSPLVLGNGNFTNPATTQSFYFGGGGAQANEATIIVHVPAEATLLFDGQPTQSRATTRVFHSPPLESGKTYTYEVTAEINRGGQIVRDRRQVDVQAGRQTEVTMNFTNAGPNRNPAGFNPGNVDEDVPATRTRRSGTGTLPTPPRDR